MKKRTPDAKAWWGLTVGGVVAVIVGFLGKKGLHLDANQLTLLTSAVAVVGSFVGHYLAPYEPRANEIVAYVENLWNELHS